jgi:predicted transcriptional regulator
MIETENNKQSADENLQMDILEKNQVWEDNHTAITKAIAQLIRHEERWPTKAEIAEETGLSRTTVYKHLAEIGKQDLMAETIDDLKCMSSMITAKLCELALGGDAKSMRIAFELMGLLKKGKNPAAPVV